MPDTRRSQSSSRMLEHKASTIAITGGIHTLQMVASDRLLVIINVTLSRLKITPSGWTLKDSIIANTPKERQTNMLKISTDMWKKRTLSTRAQMQLLKRMMSKIEREAASHKCSRNHIYHRLQQI